MNLTATWRVFLCSWSPWFVRMEHMCLFWSSCSWTETDIQCFSHPSHKGILSVAQSPSTATVSMLCQSAKILVFERPQGAADGEDNCCFLKLVESNIFGGDLAMAFLILMHSLRLVEHYLSWLIHTYSSCQNEFFRKDTEPPSDEDPAVMMFWTTLENCVCVFVKARSAPLPT